MRKLNLAFFLLALTLTFPPKPPLLAQSGSGSETLGVEVSDRKGSAISGAHVYLELTGASKGQGFTAVATDSRGRAVLAGLSPGTWQIEVEHPEYLAYVAVLTLDRGKKPKVVTSFLQAGSGSLTPMKVKLTKASPRDASAPLPTEAIPEAKKARARIPAPVLPVPATAPPEPEPAAQPPDDTAPATASNEPVREISEEPTITPTALEMLEDDEPGATEPAEPEPTEPESTQPEPTTPEPRELPAPVTTTAKAEPLVPPTATEPEPVPPVTSRPEPVAPSPKSAPPAPEPEPEEPALAETPPVEPIAATVRPSEPAPAEPPAPDPVPARPSEIETTDPVGPEPAATPAPESLATEPMTGEQATPTSQPVSPPAEPEGSEPSPVPPPAEAPPAVPAPPARQEPVTPAATEPAPGPQAPAPELPTEAPAEAPVPAAPSAPPAPSAGPVRPAPADSLPMVRSQRDGGCSECRDGEWAVSSSRVAAAAPASGSGCQRESVGAFDEAMRSLSDSIQLELEMFLGPAADGTDDEAIRRVEPDIAETARSKLAPIVDGSSSCQVVGVVLPKSVRFVGFRYEVADSEGEGECVPGQECPTGEGRWLGRPVVEKGPSATVVYGVFENRSPERERLARLIVYFRAPSAHWRPRGYSAQAQ